MEELSTYFPQEDIQQKAKKKTQQVHKRGSTSLITRKTQTKSTMRYHFTPVKMAIIKKTRDKCRQDIEKKKKKGTLVLCWQECKLTQSLWKTAWRFLS